jgi:RNA polymerase sigma-70 factor (ECF subfamily)
MIAMTQMAAHLNPSSPPPDAGQADERALLAALAAGDRQAAERLVERTYRGVYGLLLRLSGDADTAADLTQEAYRRAWAGLAGFDGRARFSTWLYRIAYTTFLNHLRRPRLFQPLDERQEETVLDPTPSAEESVGSAVEGDRLRRAVLALPDDLRFTVTALYWGDLPVREVALHEGVTTVAIRKRLRRALQMLALALGEEAR